MCAITIPIFPDTLLAIGKIKRSLRGFAAPIHALQKKSTKLDRLGAFFIYRLIVS